MSLKGSSQHSKCLEQALGEQGSFVVVFQITVDDHGLPAYPLCPAFQFRVGIFAFTKPHVDKWLCHFSRRVGSFSLFFLYNGQCALMPLEQLIKIVTEPRGVSELKREIVSAHV